MAEPEARDRSDGDAVVFCGSRDGGLGDTSGGGTSSRGNGNGGVHNLSDGGSSSTVGAGFNMVCTVVGTGLLQLPFGLSLAGWVGVPLLVLMALMAAYTARVLGLCFGMLRQRQTDGLLSEEATTRAKTYGDVGEAAFGAVGRWFVTVQMHLTLIMVATIYHLLAMLNVHWLSRGAIGLDASALLVGLLLWLHVWLQTLGDVALLSYANVSINAALLAVVIAEVSRSERKRDSQKR